jgi:Ni,Fe-hydrogenase maturation factor
MLPQYTFKPFAPWKLDWVNHVILHDLNKNMGMIPTSLGVHPADASVAKIFPGMSEEVDIALPIELPTSTGESTRVSI